MKNTEKPFVSEDMFYGNISEEKNFIESLTESQLNYFLILLKSYKFQLVQNSIKDATEKWLIYRKGWLTVLDNFMKMIFTKQKVKEEDEKNKLNNNSMVFYKEKVKEDWNEIDNFKKIFW